MVCPGKVAGRDTAFSLGSDRHDAPSEPHVQQRSDLQPYYLSAAAMLYACRRSFFLSDQVSEMQLTLDGRRPIGHSGIAGHSGTAYSWGPARVSVNSSLPNSAAHHWFLLDFAFFSFIFSPFHMSVMRRVNEGVTHLSPAPRIEDDVRFSRQFLQSPSARFFDFDAYSCLGERLPQIPNALQRRLRNPSLVRVFWGESRFTSVSLSLPQFFANRLRYIPCGLPYLKVEPGIVADLVGGSDELVDRHLR